jgi:hypothetical protein
MAWEPLEDLDRRAARLGLEAFCARHPGPFLIRLQDPPPGQQVQWVPVLNAVPGGKMLIPRAHSGSTAHELLKVSGKGARSKLYVGRGAENDVVLEERSISTTHAFLESAEDGSWRLVDAGSRNGIRHNGAKVNTRDGSALASGDVLVLGDVPLAYFSSAEMLSFLPTWCAS